MRIKCALLFTGIFLFAISRLEAQFIYYKNPDEATVRQFRDTANRVIGIDSNSLLKKQFNYIFKFYPKMLVKHIIIEFNRKENVVKVKPKFSSIFKMPSQRIYTVYFSKSTKSTLDSVLLENLSFNAQLGLLATQVSVIEDLSTGGFFNFIGWYFKHLGHNGMKRVRADAERRTLEVGLGYQLLALNTELEEKLKIDNWMDTKGYANYMHHYKNRNMKAQTILNFMNDLPVYRSHTYK